jgi:hypothetical protein
MLPMYILSVINITIVNVWIIIFCAYKCRRAARRRENCANDVAKLLAFFTECKKQNPQYADYGDAVTFDTTHKTNIYDKPLGMFIGTN